MVKEVEDVEVEERITEFPAWGWGGVGGGECGGGRGDGY